MKKIKHSKFKNTGILFELLVRQITFEVLNGDKNENAQQRHSMNIHPRPMKINEHQCIIYASQGSSMDNR